MIGPSSVGSQLTTKVLSFGGDICTATDVAIAAGICEGIYPIICTNRWLLKCLPLITGQYMAPT